MNSLRALKNKEDPMFKQFKIQKGNRQGNR